MSRAACCLYTPVCDRSGGADVYVRGKDRQTVTQTGRDREAERNRAGRHDDSEKCHLLPNNSALCVAPCKLILLPGSLQQQPGSRESAGYTPRHEGKERDPQAAAAPRTHRPRESLYTPFPASGIGLPHGDSSPPPESYLFTCCLKDLN